jgi:phosphatidylglycerophosphate synthase
VVPVGRALVGALLALTALLIGLSVLVRLEPLSWLVGLGSGAVVATAVGRAFGHGGFLGPADLVTLTRAMIACAVASLVAASWHGSPVSGALVALAVAALVLDAVDGRVARATRPTDFGGRFDGEADAFLLLVLSVHVALAYGGWVLAIGLARYAFWAAGAAWPWMRHTLPRRDWRKVVTAVQGVVLVVAAADLAPTAATRVALLAALAMLAESFGRDVWWLVRHRYRLRRVGAAAS